VLDETQRMPWEAMLYAYTRNAAAVLDMQQDIGPITPGKLADLVLVDRDLLTVPSDALKDAKVIWTLFGGQVVYGTAP
jgi:predicted amidohydrolase YtcJ